MQLLGQVAPGCTDAVDDIKASMAIVHGHIDEMVAEGIPASKIVVGGFSQGGCMSLVSTLTYPKTYVLYSIQLCSARLIDISMVYL
jgi:predicted esterase